MTILATFATKEIITPLFKLIGKSFQYTIDSTIKTKISPQIAIVRKSKYALNMNHKYGIVKVVAKILIPTIRKNFNFSFKKQFIKTTATGTSITRVINKEIKK
ncbi:MAG: hypothetical protein LBU14_01380 [Candidatus Peribacteria bacterium]|jgi:hypothetical protein|nr:hypothetical protein [Candidatus Peribacteria bacterium]